VLAAVGTVGHREPGDGSVLGGYGSVVLSIRVRDGRVGRDG
jgi:hypothetical protein